MSRLVVVVALVVFALGAAKFFLPSATLQRPDIVATPSLDGKDVRSEVPLKPGKVACIKPLPFSPDVRQVRLLLHATGNVGPALRMVATAPGWRATGMFSGYAASDANPVTAPLSTAPPRTADGQICVRNTGRRAVGLVGTNEPESQTIPVTYIDGKSTGDTDPAVTFFSGRSHSIAQQAGTIADRAAGFTGALPSWLVWLLAILFFVGVPLGGVLALAMAVGPDRVSRDAAE
jgi:hypothetical protein